MKLVTDSSFDTDVLKAQKPVLVDFFAEWCGPCRQMMSVLDDVSQAMSGQINIVKVNIDENPATPSHYGVRSIPTLMLFKDGKAVATKVGGTPKNELIEWIKSAL